MPGRRAGRRLGRSIYAARRRPLRGSTGGYVESGRSPRRRANRRRPPSGVNPTAGGRACPSRPPVAHRCIRTRRLEIARHALRSRASRPRTLRFPSSASARKRGPGLDGIRGPDGRPRRAIVSSLSASGRRGADARLGERSLSAHAWPPHPHADWPRRSTCRRVRRSARASSARPPMSGASTARCAAGPPGGR